jgi:hypothetical protein
MKKLSLLVLSILLLSPTMSAAQDQQSMYDYIINQAVGPSGGGSDTQTLDVDQMYPRQQDQTYGGTTLASPPPSHGDYWCDDGSIPIFEICADGRSAHAPWEPR